MAISVFDLYKVGIGPSSSHTVGPMVAARLFVNHLITDNKLISTGRIKSRLYGSLGATGKGHGSDKAIMLGLLGETPEAVPIDKVSSLIASVRTTKSIHLAGKKSIDFNEENDLILYRKKTLPFHSNGMKFTAYDDQGNVLLKQIYYSVGGGFVVDESSAQADDNPLKQSDIKLPYPFSSADELLSLCKQHGLSISKIMLNNEMMWRTPDEIHCELMAIWHVMEQCVKNGCHNRGILPGGLKVKRRAAKLYESLNGCKSYEPFNQGSMDWVNLYAMAVNEENAAGGRVVTAPTNGAAGIIPAVMHYYKYFCSAYKNGSNNLDKEKGLIRFMLTAGAIGILIKQNASISGAEVGCQGEVGSACAMAAAGLTEVLGGTPEQVENAAEIGIEHNLGLTCDPIGGLVQVPCIERNAMGAVKAINASRMSLRSDGKHYVSLDKVIATMRETGKDMRSKYKETSRGGLAIQVVEVPVNIVEC